MAYVSSSCRRADSSGIEVLVLTLCVRKAISFVLQVRGFFIVSWPRDPDPQRIFKMQMLLRQSSVAAKSNVDFISDNPLTGSTVDKTSICAVLQIFDIKIGDNK